MKNESYSALMKIWRLLARLERNGVTMQIEGKYWRDISQLSAQAAAAIDAEIAINPQSAAAVSRLPKPCCP
jgi:hypothetical protein